MGDPLYGPGGVPKNDEATFLKQPQHQLAPSAATTTQQGQRRSAVPTDCGYYLHAWKVEFEHPDMAGGAISLAAEPVPPDLDVSRVVE